MKKAQSSAKGRKRTASKVSRRARARVKPATRSGRPAARGSTRKAAAPRVRKGSKRSRAVKASARPVKPQASPAPPAAPILRKGLPVSKASLRRPGKYPMTTPRPEIKSIIVYTTAQKPRNDYPKRIISPPLPSACCTAANRLRVGKIHEELGRNYYYKMCKACGHTVKYYFNVQSDLDSPKFRKYYEWKKSVFH